MAKKTSGYDAATLAEMARMIAHMGNNHIDMRAALAALTAQVELLQASLPKVPCALEAQVAEQDESPTTPVRGRTRPTTFTPPSCEPCIKSTKVEQPTPCTPETPKNATPKMATPKMATPKTDPHETFTPGLAAIVDEFFPELQDIYSEYISDTPLRKAIEKAYYYSPTYSPHP